MLASTPSITQWHQSVSSSTRWPTFLGFGVLVCWIAGFGFWAATAPIDGAVVASGSFVVTGQNKIVQHLEGGILKDILIKEGDLVEQGQPLIRIDDTGANAKLRRLVSRQNRLMSTQARLLAEIQDSSEITFPTMLMAASENPEVAEIIDRQRKEFIVRRARLKGEVEVLKREIQSLEESNGGFTAQIKSAEVQVKLFQEELKDKSVLLAQALARRTEVLAIQRAEARAIGELGQLLGRVGDVNEKIARANQQIAQIASTAVQKASEELRSVETELDDLKEQIRAARDVMDRIEVLAPVRGIVVKLNYHTRGGVISSGASLMELLPLNDELIIEARVLPNEVIHVKNDLPALVRLSALNQRVTPFIMGRVVYVSADSVSDSDPRRAAMPGAGTHGSFVVRIELDKADLLSKAHNFIATPGMPAEVFIKTGERTFVQYLLKPLGDSFARAFREQ